MTEPLRVEVTRGDDVESVHLVDAVIVDTDGVIVSAWGEAERAVMPRSAIKPIQAVPLVESGAADAFGLGPTELALACASHNGEPGHVEAVTAWLERIGMSVGDLACGSHLPSHLASAHALVAAGVAADATHNNCSGKHTGFLTLCRHLGIDPVGYIEADHRLQADHVTPAIEEFCRVSLVDDKPGIDGCGIPVWSVPLRALAHGWARLPGHDAGRRLVEAMVAEPFLVAGTDRLDTVVMESATRPVACKTGAEGVHCAVVVDDGLALAVKTRDGATRAADAVTRHLLTRLGVLVAEPELVTNRAGVTVGEIRVASD